MEWVSVSEALPPPDGEDYYAWINSHPVLATDGKCICVAYVLYWHDEGARGKTQWNRDGRDGYDFDGVTHWMPLPPLPEAEDARASVGD